MDNFRDLQSLIDSQLNSREKIAAKIQNLVGLLFDSIQELMNLKKDEFLSLGIVRGTALEAVSIRELKIYDDDLVEFTLEMYIFHREPDKKICYPIRAIVTLKQDFCKFDVRGETITAQVTHHLTWKNLTNVAVMMSSIAQRLLQSK